MRSLSIDSVVESFHAVGSTADCHLSGESCAHEIDNSVELVSSKSEQLKQVGIPQRTAERFEHLAKAQGQRNDIEPIRNYAEKSKAGTPQAANTSSGTPVRGNSE